MSYLLLVGEVIISRISCMNTYMAIRNAFEILNWFDNWLFNWQFMTVLYLYIGVFSGDDMGDRFFFTDIGIIFCYIVLYITYIYPYIYSDIR